MIRELRCVGGGPVLVGYYDNDATLLAHAARLNALGLDPVFTGRNVYWTSNPIFPDRVGGLNEFPVRSRVSVGDEDISRIAEIIYDVDPTRFDANGAEIQGSVAATDTEKAAAKEVALKVYKFWHEKGAALRVVDSGNGYYIFVAVNLAADQHKLVSEIIRAHAAQFDTPQAHLDPSSGNRSRITRVPGTTNRKGSASEDRPHRTAKVLLEEPGRILQADELLAMFPIKAVTETAPMPSEGELQASVRRMRDFLAHHGKNSAAVLKRGSYVFALEDSDCPNADAHTTEGGDTTVAAIVTPAGKLAFKCQHAHCTKIQWAEFKKHLEDAAEARQTASLEAYNTAVARGETPAAVLDDLKGPFFRSPDAPEEDKVPAFKKPRVEGTDYDFVLNPLPECVDGIFPRGEISLIAGPSGSGKTTLAVQLLESQARGQVVFGHTTNSLPYLLLFEDRSPAALRRTARRIGIDLAKTPYKMLNRAAGVSLADAVASALDETDPTPAVVLLEGIDLASGDVSDMQSVFALLRQLQRVAEHYHCAIVGTTGCPKMRPKDAYRSLRDQVIGSSAWARMVETIVSMQREGGEDTSERIILTILPRNTRFERFELEFSHGRLVEIPPQVKEAANDPEAAMRQWVRLQQDGFTNAEFEMCFPAGSRNTTRNRLEKLEAQGYLTRDWRTHNGTRKLLWIPKPFELLPEEIEQSAGSTVA